MSLLELDVVVGQFCMTSRSGSENDTLRLLIKNCRLPYYQFVPLCTIIIKKNNARLTVFCNGGDIVLFLYLETNETFKDTYKDFY